jgi:hypothetical protein
MTTQQLFTDKITKVGGWKGELLQKVWDLVDTNFSELTLEWKWGTACWTLNKKPVIATSSFKDFVKVNFFTGTSLTDKHNLFNSGLESKDHRSVNIFERDAFPSKELIELISQAVKR